MTKILRIAAFIFNMGYP